VHDGRVLLHRHRRLGLWLPPGGHIDEGELPDEAAVRETFEESGVRVTLVDGPLPASAEHEAHAGEPTRLVQPIGIQLEDISPGHQHIDLVYAARPIAGVPEALLAEEGVGGLAWYGPAEWASLGVTAEVTGWARAALDVIGSLPR
jgi:8-oxo-dGTP pyrophosphatase MutT (NUDIX family)